MNKKTGIISFFMAFLMLVGGCSVREYKDTFFAMNTYMSFTVYGNEAEELVYEAQKELLALEKLWSVTDEGSDVYKINHSEGKAVEVSEKTKELLLFALEMSHKTEGSFNPAIYPVVAAWGFTTGENKVPSPDELTEMLSKTGSENIQISGNTVTAENGAMIDFGAVAKGYAGDLVTNYLKSRGVTSALLDIGGNIQAIGTKPDGSCFKIGLRSPFSDDIMGVLEIEDISVVTSGNYERYFTAEDGKKYGHIIDPKTGYPVDNGLASVTIIGKEGKTCDALSTALFVMGYEQAVEFYRDNGGFDMIIVTENREIHLTQGAKEMFTLSGGYEQAEVIVIE